MPISLSRIYRIFLNVIIFVFGLFIFTNEIHALTYFEDNFNGGDLSDWHLARSMQWNNNSLPCMYGADIAEWENTDSKVGIKIGGPSCVTELAINSWNSGWNDYIFELDIKFIRGYDRNLSWRYTEGTNQFIGLHFVGTGIQYQRMPIFEIENIQPVYNGGQEYHFKVVVDGNYHEITYFNLNSPENVSIIRTWNNNPLLQKGEPVLQASVSNPYPNSEVWFDNIKISSIPHETTPPFPHYSQIDPEWKDEQYDSINNTIGEVGCALSSAAMVLDFYDLDTLPNGDPLNVSTLNQWLIDHNGYSTSGGLRFDKIAKLSKDIASQNPESYDFHALKMVRQNGEDINFSGLTSVIESAERPVIFKEDYPDSSSDFHFNVATSVIEEGVRYGIHDPYFEDRTELEIPPNLISAIYFRPSHTDLSYLTIQTQEEIEMTVGDSANNFSSESGDQIPRSYLTFEYPYANFLNPSADKEDPYWQFQQEYPDDDKYFINLKADEDDWYDVWIFSMDENGDDFIYKGRVFISQDFPTTLMLMNDSANYSNTYLIRDVDFDVLRADIEALYRMKLIKKNGSRKSLLSIVDAIENLYNLHPLKGMKLLFNLEKKVINLTKNQTEDSAKDLLLEDIYLLKMSL